MGAALEGIRILDLTTLQNGGFATVLLSDLGADVIKIEDPVLGDPARKLIPHAQHHPLGICLFFEAMNRNKRSMTLDLKKPQGKAIFHHLVKTTDVVVNNFRHGVAERLNWAMDGRPWEAPWRRSPRTASGSVTTFAPRDAIRSRWTLRIFWLWAKPIPRP